MTTLNKKIQSILVNIILFAILFFTASSSFADDSNKYNSKSYFTSQSAIPLKKGEGFYQNTLLLHNSATYAVADGLNFSGGLVLLPNVFDGKIAAYGLLNARFANSLSESIHVSGNLNIMLDEKFFQINPIVKATFGNRLNNITTGLGFSTISTYSEIGANRASNLLPFIEISGKVRLVKFLSIISESRISTSSFSNKESQSNFNNNSLINLTGIRLQFKKHKIDLALSSANFGGQFLIGYGLPYVSYAVEFGAK